MATKSCYWIIFLTLLPSFTLVSLTFFLDGWPSLVGWQYALCFLVLYLVFFVTETLVPILVCAFYFSFQQSYRREYSVVSILLQSRLIAVYPILRDFLLRLPSFTEFSAPLRAAGRVPRQKV